MSATDEPGSEGDGALRRGGVGERVPALDPGPQVDRARLERAAREILLAIGEDPSRAGLEDTPRRFADWWEEFIDYDPGRIGTTFASTSTDQMIIVSGIRVWSLCEHHLLPFWCDLTIGYIPGGTVLGLSKFARLAELAAHGLQIQEDLVSQVAEDIELCTGSRDVAVIGQGMHLCMAMRGVKSGALMTTSIMRGAFRTNATARQELMVLAGRIAAGREW